MPNCAAPRPDFEALSLPNDDPSSCPSPYLVSSSFPFLTRAHDTHRYIQHEPTG
jgi:hypothetical protein